MREGLLPNVEALEAFVRSDVTQVVGSSEAPASHAAVLAAARGDLATVIEVDRALLRTKAAFELRSASLQTGRRLIEEASIHVEVSLLQNYRSALRRDPDLGCHAVAFGAVNAAMGAEPEDVPAALLLASATALLQAAMRLGRVSHRDAQGILHRLRPVVQRLATEACGGGRSPRLRAFHPLQEIASMRHERAEARLFAS
jgi:urease accessory protein